MPLIFRICILMTLTVSAKALPCLEIERPVDSLRQSPYDTLTYSSYNIYGVKIYTMDGRKFKGLLINVDDSGVVVHPNYLQGTEVVHIHVRNLEEVKIYRTPFERSATMKIFIYGLSGLVFFTTLNEYRHHSDAKIRKSKFLISVIATMVSLPFSGLLAQQVDRISREEVQVNGNVEEFDKHKEEILSYAVWQHIKLKLHNP